MENVNLAELFAKAKADTDHKTGFFAGTGFIGTRAATEPTSG